MDYEFISKVVLIIGIYFFVNYFYKKTDWHSSSKNEKKKFQYYFNYIFIFFFITFLYIFIAFVFIVFLKESLHYLATRSYWEQIFLVLGVIVSYFYYLIISDSRKLKDNEKSSIIKEQKKLIYQLEEKINTLEKEN
ncbi:hypothetical protein [Flavobacterium tructae]|nr:hypothetical protein [Flavobacterium tructae]